MSYQDEGSSNEVRRMLSNAVTWKVMILAVSILMAILGWIINNQFSIQTEMKLADRYDREERIRSLTSLEDRITRAEGTSSDIKAQLAAIQADISWIRIKLKNDE